jgi:hypothetical protein
MQPTVAITLYTIIYVPNRYFHKDFNLLQNQHDIKYANDSFAHFDLKYRQRTPKRAPTWLSSHIPAPAPRSIPAKTATSSSPKVSTRTGTHTDSVVLESVQFTDKYKNNFICFCRQYWISFSRQCNATDLTIKLDWVSNIYWIFRPVIFVDSTRNRSFYRIFFASKMAAKAARKSGEIIGRLRTYIPAGKASASPPLGPQLGQVINF